MEAFQKLNPQGQNAVMRNLYEVAQKSRAQEVLDLENKLSELKKATLDMDSIFPKPPEYRQGEIKYWEKGESQIRTEEQSFFIGAILQDSKNPLGPIDSAFEGKGIKSDTLDNCRR